MNSTMRQRISQLEHITSTTQMTASGTLPFATHTILLEKYMLTMLHTSMIKMLLEVRISFVSVKCSKQYVLEF